MSWSDEVFPALPGLRWSVRKSPMFRTQIQQALSGREFGVSYRQHPLFRYELSYEVLRDDVSAELTALMGFFMARRGRYESFRFWDPDANTVTGHKFFHGYATLHGSYPLYGTYAGVSFPVFDPIAVQIRSGNATSGPLIEHTVNTSGRVTLLGSPQGQEGLYWTGTYYQRVRFEEDEQEFEKFMEKLWRAQKVTLVTRSLA